VWPWRCRAVRCSYDGGVLAARHHEHGVDTRALADDEGGVMTLLTAEQAAELLNVPVSFVRQETRAERMPYVAIGARYRRYEADALRDWWKSRRRGPTVASRSAA
jgi:excisionase family DNA binding protein